MAKRKTAAPKRSKRENEHYREARKETNAHRRKPKRK